ncbi:hypothetical protein T484DRAFT_1782209 [Baffinella frigidus]|nr:hypothetical protein T484DRAFT_1782209 [Cryptophyta sp. CCMP2293]
MSVTSDHAVAESECVTCDQDFYSIANGSANCTACPAHAVSPGGAALPTDCRCIPGWEGEDGQECTACEPGEYKPTFGSATCSKCAAGEYATVVRLLASPSTTSGHVGWGSLR